MPEIGNIAFLGLGAMGFGMATNILTHKLPVTGFDVWAPTLQRFVAAGGSSSPTPREAVKNSTHIVFMVATAAQILSALFDPETGAIESLKQGATLILSSTGPPEHSPNVKKLLVEKYGRSDIKVVDAPVSGGTIRAANGTLTILASGEEDALASARPLLDIMAGMNLYIIPGGLGAGTNVKMVHQVLAGIHIVMSSEAMGFAAKLGLDTKVAFEYLSKSEGTSWMFENRGPHMIVKDEKVYSALNIIVKDVGIITAATRPSSTNPGFPLFLSSTTEQVLATGVSAGFGLEDDAQLTKVYLPSTPTLVLDQATASPGTSGFTPEAKSKLDLVRSTMEAVHLVSAMESMSLGKSVGLDTQQLFEIIKGAAGGSWMFADKIPQLLSGKWTSRKTVNGVIADLTKAITAANALKYPLHLASAVLQILQLAALKGYGAEPDLAASRVWDGPEGAMYPGSKA
ncbi:NAD binding domain of 6-phosphogluconate dehydrogenase-domain-containing protein [Amylocarpus encephaloides]|uniref:NAD binding domain of 6-phosphogluconate dehydrogenase-domain-containing protein n=1 Tax=Amylocarpus encephaloides TaxID=45428 RepID=A0A9P7YR84_9HELO|nr:NAD binding domain of 6-phosphogluconate dehydrogenase-domain-containing protein [Amylocarpus encephaloides]